MSILRRFNTDPLLLVRRKEPQPTDELTLKMVMRDFEILRDANMQTLDLLISAGDPEELRQRGTAWANMLVGLSKLSGVPLAELVSDVLPSLIGGLSAAQVAHRVVDAHASIRLDSDMPRWELDSGDQAVLVSKGVFAHAHVIEGLSYAFALGMLKTLGISLPLSSKCR